MKFELQDVSGWNSEVMCVCTALGAITGKKPNEIAKLISLQAAKTGKSVPADPNQSFDINHWLPVIRELGGDWVESENFSTIPYAERQTITQYIANIQSDDVILVFGQNEENSDTHVFAMSDGHLVDTYTDGKKIPTNPDPVPKEYNNFRVKRVFLVWDASTNKS